jgi:hypothetical protein
MNVILFYNYFIIYIKYIHIYKEITRFKIVLVSLGALQEEGKGKKMLKNEKY